MKKKCYFEENNIEHIDYKDIKTLKNFTNPHGRILSSKNTGTKRKSQKKLAEAIKRARFMGLLAYTDK